MGFLRQYLIAVQSFTRVPVTGTLAQWIDASPESAQGSAAHFPGVGWLVGIVACATFALVGLLLPDSAFAPLAAGVACIVATSILTGAVHEKSLARAIDSLGGLGGLALLLTVMAKVSLLAVLASHSPAAVMLALLAAHVASRFWPLLLLAERLDRRALGIAAAWSLAAFALAAAGQSVAFAIAAVVASGIALLAMQKLFARRLQGFNDDGFGATQQVCEVAFYLGAAVGLGIR